MAVDVRRPRDAAERARAIQVARVAFGADLEPSRFLATRLASEHRRHAAQWLLEADGEIAASLLAFPLAFRTPAGDDVDGVGLGSVGTLPTARRRGHAEALCRTVVEDAAAHGAPLALLFSAVPPALYGRVGFGVAAGWEHTCDDVAGLAAARPAGGEALPWEPLDPHAGRAAIMERYDATHAGTLHLRRDAAAWERSLLLRPKHLWLGLDGGRAGYARVFAPEDDSELFVVELCLAEPGQQAAALVGLARIAERWGCAKLESWLPPTPGLEAWFRDVGRAKTLPMVRGTDAGAHLRVWAADYF